VKLHTSERALIVANVKMIVAGLIAQIHIFVWSSVLLYLRKMAIYDLIAVSSVLFLLVSSLEFLDEDSSGSLIPFLKNILNDINVVRSFCNGIFI
jgi:hypothetical protein